MTSEKALNLIKIILKKLYDEDYKALAIMMNEEANGINDFIISNIKELQAICELALKELENDK